MKFQMHPKSVIKIVKRKLQDGQDDITSFWATKVLECEASFRSAGKTEFDTKRNFTHFLYALNYSSTHTFRRT